MFMFLNCSLWFSVAYLVFEIIIKVFDTFWNLCTRRDLEIYFILLRLDIQFPQSYLFKKYSSCLLQRKFDTLKIVVAYMGLHLPIILLFHSILFSSILPCFAFPTVVVEWEWVL